jgi:outer membrane protein OmpA-like peptidoglycan-associated protein
VQKIAGVNTMEDEIMTGIMNQALLVARSKPQGLISDWSEDEDANKWTVNYVPRRATWQSVETGDWPFALKISCEQASFCLQDSMLYYSKMTSLSTNGIFSRKLSKDGWLTEKDLNLNSETLNASQPAISTGGDELVFVAKSQDQAGTDIVYVVKSNDTWGNPKKLDPNINDGGVQLMPQWNGNDILFSSRRVSGIGGFDVYKTTKSSQWTQVELLPTPLNSEFNDLTPVMLNGEKGFFSSNRETGGYNVFIIQELKEEVSVPGYTALLECKGVPVQNAAVKIFNDLQEVVLESSTDRRGTFDLKSLKLKKSYSVKFSGQDPKVLKNSFLYILDESGNRIMVFAPGADGLFIFELLPKDEIEGMQSMDEKDEWTLLAVDVKGQVFEEEPGDIEEGVPIYILDESGELMALAYTTEKGKFHFDQLSPQAQYSFRLDEESNATSMVIFDGEDEILIPFIEGKGEYERIPTEESVNLVNEKGQTIAIKREETFIIEHIYYALNMADLNLIAKYQLDQLASIMTVNADIRIELNSHTDSRGENLYNLELSQRRANTAVNYLLQKGLSKDRMVAKGYGETKLLNGCKDDVVCAEEDHALNRRTEIKIFIR